MHSAMFLFLVIGGIGAVTPPAWGINQVPAVSLVGGSCVRVSWSAPSVLGTPPVSCYEVQLANITGVSNFSVIDRCAVGNQLTRCSLVDEFTYTFKVTAIGASGRRSGESSSSSFQLGWLRSAESQSVISSPAWNQISFVAGSFPSISVEVSNDGNIGWSSRIFVATLVNRCKLDSASGFIIPVPLSASDANFTSATLPLPVNAAPVFTDTLLASATGGVYTLTSPSVEPSVGAYSLIVFSLEGGGLWGQYWVNPSFSGSPTISRKDGSLEFTWQGTPIVNGTSARASQQVSARWTGFIEAAYTETFTFMVETSGSVRLWVEDVLVINKGSVSASAGGSVQTFTGQAGLRASSAASRKFSRIRIDFVQFQSNAARSARMVLRWISPSQPIQVIPSERFFKAIPVQSTVKSIDITAGTVDAAQCSYSLPVGALVTGGSYKFIIAARDSRNNPIFGNSQITFSATFTSLSGSPQAPSSYTSSMVVSNGTYVIAFSVPVSDSYTVNIREVGSGSSISGSPFTLTIGASGAYVVPSMSLDADTLFTDSTYVIIQFPVWDSSNNPLPSTAVISGVNVAVTWTSDSLTASRLPVDDVAWRSRTYGTSFPATLSYNATVSSFQAAVPINRAGSFSASISVNGGGATLVQSFTVAASRVSVGSNSVVVSSLFPPAALLVGVE